MEIDRKRLILIAGVAWRFLAAGLLGTLAHAALMWFKATIGLLPDFRPYLDFQHRLTMLAGASVHPVVPWVLSFLNGAVVFRLVFGQVYAVLPGRGGVTKGLTFGVFGWLVMGLAVFPWLGRGVFATGAGYGLWPAAFSLLMVLTYSTVLGLVYAMLSVKADPGDAPRH